LNHSFLEIRWRLFWSSIVALVLAIGCFSLAQWVYAPSDDQCLWSIEDAELPWGGPRPHAVIRSVIPKGAADAAALMDGDELIGIHDLKIPGYSKDLTYEENRAMVERAAQKMRAFINSTPDGTTVQYTVMREGQRIALPLELKKTFDTTNAVLLLTGIVAWVIGLLVVMSSPQRKVARHFYYLGVLTLLMAAGASISGQYTVPVGLDIAARFCRLLFSGLFPPLWFHFFLGFPYGFVLSKRPIFIYGIYIFNFVTLLPEVIMLCLDFLGLTNVDWMVQLLLGSLPVSIETFVSASQFFQLALLGGGVLLFWIGAFKIPRRRRKALMAPMLFTVASILDLFAYLWLANTFAGTPDWGFFQRASHYMFLPLPLLPITFAYAILRHGFFDVRRVIIRWLTYFLSLGILMIAYLAVLAMLFAIIMPDKIPMHWLGTIVGLLAIPLAWILKWMMAALRRKFKKDVGYSRDYILDNIRNVRKSFSESELIKSFVSSIQEAFRPQVSYCLPVVNCKAVLPAMTRKAHSGTEHSKVDSVYELILPPKLLRHAKESREVVYDLGNDESDWISAQSKELRVHLDVIGVQLMVILIASDQPHSILLLGGKYAELGYHREDRELLREVAIAAGIIIESAVMHRQVLEKTRLDQELLAAQKIQQSLITLTPPVVPGFQIASRLVPAAETGGDLLWVKQRAPGRWISVVGDVSGKGLAAALYMSQSVALLEHASQDPDAPLENMLASMDKSLRHLMSNKDFLTLSMIEWSEDGQFKVVRAGHPPPILLASSKPDAPIFVSPAGLALGILPASKAQWQVFEGTLQPGDWIAMYSDGITEAMDSGSNLYGAGRLADQLKKFWHTGSARAACEAIFQNVTTFEALNRDDMTLFIMAREKDAQGPDGP